MQREIQIVHHGFEVSEALDERIREEAEKLEKFHHGIIGCRVAIERESHRHESHDAWEVKVIVTVPPRHELVASKVAEGGSTNAEVVYKALEGAFQAVGKQLRKVAEKHA